MFAWAAWCERVEWVWWGGKSRDRGGAAFPLRLCCWCCATSGFYGFTVSSFASCSDSKSSSRIIRNAPARNNSYGYEWNNVQEYRYPNTPLPAPHRTLHIVQMVLSFAHSLPPQLLLSLFRQALGIIIKVLRPSGSCQSVYPFIHRQRRTVVPKLRNNRVTIYHFVFRIYSFPASFGIDYRFLSALTDTLIRLLLNTF